MRLLCCIVVAALVAGCTEDPQGNATAAPDAPDEPDPGPQENTTVEENRTAPEDPEPREPVTWEIVIEGNDFVDGSITVQEGDTVEWLHRDGAIQHTVTSDGGTFDSGSCPGIECMTELTNDSFSWTFEETGEFPYHCEVHPSMRDTITVLAVYNGTPDAP